MAGETDKSPQTTNSFNKYIKDYLKNDLKNAISEEKVSCQNILSQNKVQAYLDCCFSRGSFNDLRSVFI